MSVGDEIRLGSFMDGEQMPVADVEHFPHPDRMVEVVGEWTAGIGMNEYSQSTTIYHEPRQEAADFMSGKGDLIHRLCMRANRLIVPATENDRKALRDVFPQDFGDPSLLRAVKVNMRVIAAYRFERLYFRVFLRVRRRH
ncbi:hypothetical protein A9Z05_07030 [Burkholderia sp. A2]|nr:hypothetical protein A9Z05_07030 [Burkholderia sp. A2]